jgi:Ca2+-binding RTX toxin-like protein
MNNPTSAREGARIMGATILAAALAALLVAFVLAKPSEAADSSVKVDPTRVGFGALEVSANPETRTITIKNIGSSDVQIGGASTTITGPDAGDFNLLPQVRDAITGLPLPGDLSTGVTLGAGESAQFDVSFDASSAEVRNAVLKLTDTSGNPVQDVDLTGSGVNQLPQAGPDCTITGTNNGETLTGTPENDVICAMGGNDQVNGLGGSDTLRGGAGKDRLVDSTATRSATSPSSPEADKLFGQRGRDRINAKDGDSADVVNGGPQRDRVRKDKGDQGKRR